MNLANTTAAIDASIGKTEGVIADLTAKAEAAKGEMARLLAEENNELAARKAAAEAAEAIGEIKFEAARLDGLQNKRAELEKAQAKAQHAADLANIVTLAEKRVALAKKADAAVKTAGLAVAELMKLSDELDTAILKLPKGSRPNLRHSGDDVQHGLAAAIVKAGCGRFIINSGDVAADPNKPVSLITARADRDLATLKSLH